MKCMFGSWQDHVLCEVSALSASSFFASCAAAQQVLVSPAGYGGKALMSLAGRRVLILLWLQDCVCCGETQGVSQALGAEESL